MSAWRRWIQRLRRIHCHNVKRVIRALEYYEQTGQRISAHNEEQREKESPYRFAYFVLNDERERLYGRIDARVDEMIKEGLVAEVEALKKEGCRRDMVSMQGLGYKEILDYLDGERRRTQIFLIFAVILRGIHSFVKNIRK